MEPNLLSSDRLPELTAGIASLENEVAEQQIVVQEFREALDDILQPPKYPAPKPTEPLKAMQQMLEQAASEQHRQEILATAKSSLHASSTYLATLEAELAGLEKQKAAIEAWQTIEPAALRLQAALEEAKTAWQEFSTFSKDLGGQIRAVSHQAMVEVFEATPDQLPLVAIAPGRVRLMSQAYRRRNFSRV